MRHKSGSSSNTSSVFKPWLPPAGSLPHIEVVQGIAWTYDEFKHVIRDLWFSSLELSSPSSESVVATGVFLLVPEKWWHFLSESEPRDISAGQSAWKRKEKLTVAPSFAASPQTACFFFPFSEAFKKLYIYIIYLLLPAPIHPLPPGSAIFLLLFIGCIYWYGCNLW